jgi:hypothetical protein
MITLNLVICVVSWRLQCVCARRQGFLGAGMEHAMLNANTLNVLDLVWMSHFEVAKDRLHNFLHADAEQSFTLIKTERKVDRRTRGVIAGLAALCKYGCYTTGAKEDDLSTDKRAGGPATASSTFNMLKKVPVTHSSSTSVMHGA